MAVICNGNLYLVGAAAVSLFVYYGVAVSDYRSVVDYRRRFFVKKFDFMVAVCIRQMESQALIIPTETDINLTKKSSFCYNNLNIVY